MEGFDDPGVFFSDNFAGDEGRNENQINLQGVKKKFKDFIRQFHSDNFNYKYRDTLKRNYNLRNYYLEVNIEDVGSFDETLAEKLYKQPAEHLPVFEEAAKEVADELTAPRPEGEEHLEDIQIMLSSDAQPSNLRALKNNWASYYAKKVMSYVKYGTRDHGIFQPRSFQRVLVEQYGHYYFPVQKGRDLGDVMKVKVNCVDVHEIEHAEDQRK